MLPIVMIKECNNKRNETESWFYKIMRKNDNINIKSK